MLWCVFRLPFATAGLIFTVNGDIIPYYIHSDDKFGYTQILILKGLNVKSNTLQWTEQFTFKRGI